GVIAYCSRLAWQRFPRMQIDGHLQLRYAVPEFPNGLLVEIHDRFVRPDIGIAVDQCAFQAELADGSFKLVRRSSWVLKSDGGESREPVGVFLYKAGGVVVRIARHGSSRFLIDDGLHAG